MMEFSSCACSSVKPATSEGDNYMSEMFRIKVQIAKDGKREERYLILKTVPKKESMLKIVSAGNVFGKETIMFRDILPALHRLLEEASPGEYQKFGARYIYSLTGFPATLLMLEDLKVLGFKMADRMDGLDMEHCRLVLRTLAHFHAASLALHERNPSMFEVLRKSIYCNDMRSNVEGFFFSSINKLAREVETWPGFNERFSKKLHKLADNAMDLWINAVECDENDFNVLTHGDLWMNNMMFRYSENGNKLQDVRRLKFRALKVAYGWLPISGETSSSTYLIRKIPSLPANHNLNEDTVNVKFVDFQLCYWTSPTIDLLYFLNSSPTVDISEQYDVLLREYHQALGETLKTLGLEELHPPLHRLESELEKRGIFGAIAGLSIRSVVLADRDNVPDMDKLINEKEGAPLSESFKRSVRQMLPFYEQKGWI